MHLLCCLGAGIRFMNQRITSHQLEIFCHLATHLSFTKVAEVMGLTRSAISHALRSLESEVGCQLLDRDARHAVLTEAGLELFADARHILGLMQDAHLRLAARSSRASGIVRISMLPEHCSLIFPAVLREFRESFPEYRFSFTEAPLPDLEGLFRTGHLDLAFAPEPCPATRCEPCFQCEEEFRYVVHPLHPWAVRRSAEFNAGTLTRMVVKSHDSAFLVGANRSDDGARGMPEPWFEVTSYEAVKELALRNLAVGVLPSWFIAKELKDRQLVSFALQRRKLARQWTLLRSSHRKVSVAENALCGLISNVIATRWSSVAP
jgi:LysR family transcriptional regulator, low CO2-responsive transcriptional regulator